VEKKGETLQRKKVRSYLQKAAGARTPYASLSTPQGEKKGRRYSTVYGRGNQAQKDSKGQQYAGEPYGKSSEN